MVDGEQSSIRVILDLNLPLPSRYTLFGICYNIFELELEQRTIHSDPTN